MDRILFYASLFVITVLGVGIALCAFHILSAKMKRLAIWKMPRLRLVVLAGACVVATIAAQKNTGVRYVDANAPSGGNGLSWNTAARTIDEVSRDLSGGTIYVKPGTYGAFSYWTVGDYISSNPLKIIATGDVGETIINGKMSPKSDVLTPTWTTLQLSGFTVCGVSDIWYVDLDGCVVSNCHEMAACGSAFKNCLLTENSAYFLACTYSGCTVVGNSGSCITAGSSAAWNTIFWNNSSGGGAPNYDILAATNCCMDVMREGTGNFSEDPQFVDAANGNYRLADGSPCIDAGENAATAGDRDLTGSARVKNDHVDIGAYENCPPPPPAQLVYRSTLDSDDAIREPLVGEHGTCANATFVEGKMGMALSVPAGTSVASIPFPDGLPAERGTIEFWAKLNGNKVTFSDGGDPMLLHFSRVSTSEHFGWIEFNANNGGGRGGIGASIGGVGLYSNGYLDSHDYSSIMGDKVSDWHHYALVWNVEGISTLVDCPRFALLLDGKIVAQTNGDGNWRKSAFIANMSVPVQMNLSYPGLSSGKSPYFIDELRVWNADVTTFQQNLDDTETRYVNANAPEGGVGDSWETAARTIGEVSQGMNGGVIWVKPGTYGAFTYKKPQGDGLLKVIATGRLGETVIDGAGTGVLVSDSGEQPTSTELRLEGFIVRNMGAPSRGQCFDRCMVSNFTHGVASSSSFLNCLVVANSAISGEKLFEACSFANCTVVGNVPVVGSSMNGCGAKNTIFWENGALGYTGLVATNCCVEGGMAGAFIIADEPKFVDPAKGNWCLAADSPCIDAGLDAGAVGDRDLAGNVRIQGAHVDIGAYESRPPTPLARLVYHNTLDSADAVVHPVIGATGTCGNATFVDGKVGSALYVPADSNVANLPLPNGLPVSRGCIEFWAKLQEGKTTFRDCGDPIFLRVICANDAVSSFTIEFNANDGGGRGGLCGGLPGLYMTSEGFSYVKYFSNYFTEGNVSDWHHYALVWNVDGIATINGNPRSALLVDGKSIAQTNGDGAWDNEAFLTSVSQPFSMTFSKPGTSDGKSPFTIDELKIWDSDKTTFRGLVTHQSVSYVYDGTAHTLQPAVGAEGDEVLRYALSEEGPFVEEMPTITDAGSLRIWYEVEAEGETTRDSATVTVTKRPLTFTSASAQKPYDGTPLLATNILVSGGVPLGEWFAFSVTGSQTIVGESANGFTWEPQEGTNPDNYDVTVAYGTLKVTMGPVDAGTEYEIIHGETDAVRITRLPYPNGGNVTLPSTLGGLPVAEIAAGALAGTSVTGVRVPSGVVVSGALFENLPNVTNVTLDAGCAVTGALSCRGSAALQEVVVAASVTELAPHAFLGCWALERVVFAGEPPFGNNTNATAELALLTASVRPASLLQMADMICYPATCAAKWEKSLRNLGYGGTYGAYEGEWTGIDSLIADSGNLGKPGQTVVTNEIVTVVSNVIVTVVTNVSPPVVPAEQPSALYAAQVGVASGTVMSGASGWDVVGLPEGMTWDRNTGTLGGTPVVSGTYDVLLISGSGLDTRVMRTTIDVSGYAVTTGYVGVALCVSGEPWNSLVKYKTAPAGLAWNGKVLSGVPRRTGTTTFNTTAGESVTLVILPLPAEAVGTYSGTLLDDAGNQYPLTVTVSSSGKLEAMALDGAKSYALSAAAWSNVAVEDVSGSPHRMFTATLSGDGLSLVVKLDADAAPGAEALTVVDMQNSLTGSAPHDPDVGGGSASDVFAALAGQFSLTATPDGAGGWTLALPGSGVKGTLTVVVKPTGKATLSGTLPDKTKVSATAAVHVDADGATVRFRVNGMRIVWNFL